MKNYRRNSALSNVVNKRLSIHAPVDLNALVRVYFLDGSSKVLQMKEKSTVADVLSGLKFNLDLVDISNFALFRVCGQNVRLLGLHEVVQSVLKSVSDDDPATEVRILFRSWIYFKYGSFDWQVFQYGQRSKAPTSALWLAFMEASFLCQSGLFFLTEDESLKLGCLKLQAESGDFCPRIHNTDLLKGKVLNRFPNPIKEKMRALCSSTLSGNNLADDLAIRVQALYSRLAGKSKLDAQIDFLESLRTWCPFYGATFFNVQCQYDENPTSANSSPPTLPMRVSIGPSAILLSEVGGSSSFVRHPYSRILRWIAQPDKNVFAYWVLKTDASVPGADSGSEDEADKPDLRAQCDCVYFVSSQVDEIKHLVQSYIDAFTGIPPHLPDAFGDLLPVAQPNPSSDPAAEPAADKETQPVVVPSSQSEPDTTMKKGRFSRLSSIFSFGGSSSENSGAGLYDSSVAVAARQQGYGDDASAISNSIFRPLFDTQQQQQSSSSQLVSNLSELHRLASNVAFSDSENESGGGSDSSSDSDSNSESDSD